MDRFKNRDKINYCLDNEQYLNDKENQMITGFSLWIKKRRLTGPQENKLNEIYEKVLKQI